MTDIDDATFYRLEFEKANFENHNLLLKIAKLSNALGYSEQLNLDQGKKLLECWKKIEKLEAEINEMRTMPEGSHLHATQSPSTSLRNSF